LGVLKNSKYERFAQLISAGDQSQADAYKAAGFSVANEANASKLAKRPEVKARVDELLAICAVLGRRFAEPAMAAPR